MDTNALKKFAQAARNLLIDQVTAKLDLVLSEGSAARREHPAAIKKLEAATKSQGKQQLVEQVAYTWFKPFHCAALYGCLRLHLCSCGLPC